MLSGNFLLFLQPSQLCAQQWDWKGWRRPFSSTWSCTSKLTLLRADLTDDAVLFKACAVLPVEGQPMSLQPVHSTTTFSFKISQLLPGMHSSCALLCPGLLCVLMQINAVGWSVNIAGCSSGEHTQAACTALLICPPPMSPASSAAALSLLISGCVIWGRAISQNRRQAGVPRA